VLSLTSIMSTTGHTEVGQPDAEAMMALLTPAPDGRDAAIDSTVNTSRLISGDLFDEAESRRIATESYDRCFYPTGTMFQIAAIAASGDRTEALRQLDVPTLVVHGRQDSLIHLSGGEATAAAVPGADLLVFGQMGHDMPRRYWPQMADSIFNIAARGEGV
jgi:pimeloyl-ACP methyl ester carboxylesterase